MSYWIFTNRGDGDHWQQCESRNTLKAAIERAETIITQWRRLCGLRVRARVFYGAQLAWEHVEADQ